MRNLQAAHATSKPMGIQFSVGRDVYGRWIVTDAEATVVGVFTDRSSAVHFAMFESAHSPGAVWCLPDHVTLNFGEHARARLDKANAASKNRG